MENEQAAIALLLFRVGPVLCCAPADPIQTIIAPPKLTRPPGANEAKPGIFYHAEHVVGVSELRHRFGVNADERVQPGRMIITLQGEAYVAYWVDEIIEVLDTPKQGWGEAPTYLPKGVFSKTLLLNEKIYLFASFTDFENLPESDYLSRYFDKLKNHILSDDAEDETPVDDSDAVLTPPARDDNDLTEETAPASPLQNEQAPATEHTSPSPLAGDDSDLMQTTAGQQAAAESDPGTEVDKTDEPGNRVADASVRLDRPEAKQEDTPVMEPASVIDPGTQSEINSPAQEAAPVTEELDTSDSVAEDGSPVRQGKTDYLKPVPAVIPESERPPEKPPLPWKSLAASVVLFLSLAISGVYYLLSSADKPTGETQAPVSDNTTAVTHSTETTLEPPEQVDEPQVVQTETIKQDAPEPQAEAGQTTDTDKDYRAEIKPDKEGVTIVLHTPDDAQPALKSVDEAKPAQTAATADKSDTAQQQAGQREKIIHVVVEGDTLWAIAKHYVSNPYKYPQLARLSKIKNPDRIYPGNRVLILRQSKKQP